MKPKLALVAREIIVAADTGVPTAINIVEGLRPAGFPAFLHNIAFLSVWRRELNEPTEFKGNVFVLIGDKEIAKHDASITFKGDSEIARHVAQFQGLVLEKPADLSFRVTFGNETAEYSIFVKPGVQIDTPSNQA